MAMSKPAKHLYQFGPFSVDVAERVIWREGRPAALPPKAFELLLVLVENRGHLLEKEELMRRLWPDTFVEEANLSNNISLLRKALTEDDGHRYIKTVPRRGYRFVAAVEELAGGPAELIVEELARATLTIAEESTDSVQPARSWLTGGRAKRLTGWGMAALALLAGGIAAAYYYWGRPAAAPTPIRSIAVLPFKPLAADSRDEAFELGMADTLITRLSNMRQVVVRPISAVRRYTDLEHDPVAAGREQRVEAVLEGSFQRSGERIRVTVRLLKVGDGAALWTYKCEEQCTDLFAVQDAIAEQVAAALALKLTGDERQLLAKHDTDNPEAYQLYLKGRFYWNKRLPVSVVGKAIDHFERAIAMDPTYALAYVALAECYVIANSRANLEERLPLARAAAMKALKIDGTLGEAHAALAQVEGVSWNWSASERGFKRAIELSPNYAPARLSYAELLSRQERHEEAMREIKLAQELDPLSSIINARVGFFLTMARRYDEAIEQYKKTLEMDPNFVLAQNWLADTYIHKGMYEEAITEYEKAFDLWPDAPERERRRQATTGVREAYRKSGVKGFWEQALENLRKQARGGPDRPLYMAQGYANLGDRDRAFEWLEKVIERGRFEAYIKVDPRFDQLRADPRFEVLLRRVGLAP
jgi:DNA-binding winged helix-turn-helix (wHTH) protein/TolB-like protein/Tfp pilus assembly protein PilF